MFIEPDIKTLLEQLPQTSHGKALIKLLEKIKEDANDVSTIDDWDSTLERKGRLKVVREILNSMAATPEPRRKTSQYE